MNGKDRPTMKRKCQTDGNICQISDCAWAKYNVNTKIVKGLQVFI